MGEFVGSRFTFDEMAEDSAHLGVVGVGGGGGNAINNMITEGISAVEFIAVNTDSQALNANLAAHKIQAGRALTKGLGTGARPFKGAEAIAQDTAAIESAVQGFDLVFITAGMGGGTGTGGAPIVAELARRLGILVVAIVTKPFACEGSKRMEMAVEGISKLRPHVDTLIVIPNERVLDISDDAMTMIDAFRTVDDVLYQATRGISDLITRTGLINLDFADVRTTMENGGSALMGSAVKSGEYRAEKAAMEAISSPLLDGMTISGARNLMVNITAGSNLGIHEATRATNIIKEQAGPDVEVIMGTVIDTTMEDKLRVTVIATGFDHENERVQARRTVQLADPQYDYKGEHSLRILDVPAFERRGGMRLKKSGEAYSGQSDEPGKQLRRLRRVHPANSESKGRRENTDTPAFLRKMMD